jgi:hypothetical protein
MNEERFDGEHELKFVRGFELRATQAEIAGQREIKGERERERERRREGERDVEYGYLNLKRNDGCLGTF